MQLDDKNAVIDGGGGAIGGAVVRAFARQGARTAPTAAALAATLGLAAAAWVVAVRQMDGMDMGVATELGSLAFFVAAWVPMMAAMMLPGAVPAVLKCARRNRPVRAVPLFVGSYLVVWALVGIAVYALYQPHGTFAAGALTVAAGVYELTPLKRDCRRRCRQSVRSGFEFGSRSRANDVNPMPLADSRCSDMKGERADDEPQDRNA